MGQIILSSWILHETNHIMGPIALKKLPQKKFTDFFCSIFRFYCCTIIQKAPKNYSRFLALQNTCTAVGYFKSCDFKIFIKG